MSISLSTFRKFPIDVQRDYARFYRLSDADTLTVETICRALFNETEWIPAEHIDGHLQLDTPDGVVVAREAMDLVEWLTQHPNNARFLTTRLPSPDDTYVGAENAPTKTNDTRVTPNPVNDGQMTQTNLQEIADGLSKANKCLKTAIDVSLKAVRDVCAEVFILQNQLDNESAYQSTVANILTDIVGPEVMEGITRKVDMKEKEQASRIHQHHHAARKRRRSSGSYHVITADSPHGSKRRRVEKLAPNPVPGSPVLRTILDYPSDENETDSTYSDSNGTDRDFDDDPYSLYDSRGRTPHNILYAWNLERESPEESVSDESQPGTPWQHIADFKDDSTDSDYQRPAWDLEDIWEIENRPARLNGTKHPLFQLNFADEMDDCEGILSDCGLSTDDPDNGHHEYGIIQRPSSARARYSKSLGPCLKSLHYEHTPIWHPWLWDKETLEELRQREIARKISSGWSSVKFSLEYGLFPPLDLEQRLADVLESDHTLFYFDDQEWRCFEEFTALYNT